ncbi:MAG TPA: hypothetical protein VLI94_14235 [Solirubrobacterales bacterium]|nr:hypothetical protein [Solirubrobacterales bacterium]
MPQRTVPTLSELEARIDEALVIARASEEGVGMVGEVALDAARQARRAAEAAEESARAAAAVRAAARRPRPAGSVSEADGPAGPVPDLVSPSLSGWSPKSAPPPGRDAGEGPAAAREVVIDPLQRFNERADAVAARLKKLERVPV